MRDARKRARARETNDDKTQRERKRESKRQIASFAQTRAHLKKRGPPGELEIIQKNFKLVCLYLRKLCAFGSFFAFLISASLVGCSPEEAPPPKK